MTFTNTHQEEKVGNFFSNFSSQWDSFYGGKRSILMRLLDYYFRRDIWERYKVTFNILGKNLNGKTIFDLGCGNGIYSVEAARRGASKVSGMDAAKQMIEIADNTVSDTDFAKVCQFVHGTFPNIKIQERFDYTIVMGVMDYIQESVAFLSEIRKITDSYAIISFPGDNILRALFRKYRYRILGRCEVYHYSAEQALELCRQAGFSKLDLFSISHSGRCYIITAYT